MNKRILTSLLFPSLLLTALLLPACVPTAPVGEEETAVLTEATAEVTSEAPEAVADVPFDIPADMSEVRKRTIAYFEEMAAVEWSTDRTLDYTKSCPWTSKLVYEKDVVYYGLPYSTYRPEGACLEEFLDSLDEKGIYRGPTEYSELVGVDCGAMRRAWAYGGAICDVGMNYEDWEMFVPLNTLKNKKDIIVKVGSYDDSHFSPDLPSIDGVMAYNDPSVMYESYALLKACDLIGARFFIGNGTVNQHVRMLVKDAVVVRNAEGAVDAEKSYITFSEQTSDVHEVDGKLSTWLLNQNVPFKDLFEQGYLPMSTATLQQDTVAEPDITASGFSKPENFVSSPVLKGMVKSNYNIFKLEASITDKDGSIVSYGRCYPYALNAFVSEITLSTPVKELPTGDYRFTVRATIGFGEKTVADFAFSK